MTILSTSAGPVAYDSHGSGGPIVLLPSGHEHQDYDEIRELLPGGFRSIGVGWPGHGQSPAGTAPSGRVLCALMSRPWFARRIYPLFSRAYTRPRTAADHRARAGAIAITRTTGDITAPTVLIWGRHDPVLPLSVAETARDLIPGSRLVVIESGHLPHTTRPAAVAAELTTLANAAFDAGSRTNATQYSPPGTKEQDYS